MDGYTIFGCVDEAMDRFMCSKSWYDGTDDLIDEASLSSRAFVWIRRILSINSLCPGVANEKKKMEWH
jgi:hypothetical protein|tara:strand:- start:2405 stop:2608 length:204 start_codon:yes stop_codon:yes gene_type:complete